MSAKAARPRRDALAEQQLVRDLWKQVEARIDCSNALSAFLTQKIDDCGQTIAFDAFDLVRQVLNPEGFVRRAHKSADQSLGAAISMPESPWSTEGSLVDRQWDFNGTWHKNKKSWPIMNGYENLKPSTVQYFCTKSDLAKVEYDQPAKYIDDKEDYDQLYSMPALAANQEQMKILKSLPDNKDVVKPVRRWETFRIDFSADDFLNCMNSEAQTIVCKKASSRKPRKPMGVTVKGVQKRLTQYKSKHNIKKNSFFGLPKLTKSTKQAWSDKLDALEKEDEDNDNTESDGEEMEEDESGDDDSEDNDSASAALADANEETYTLKNMMKEKVFLEPYYRLAWRSADWAANKEFSTYYYGTKHKMCNQQERPDLILEVGYFSVDTGLFTKRVVMVEVDGENKTKVGNKKRDQDDDDAESNSQKKDDPIKLALKLMSSTFAQNALQDETYHIRANYVYFFDQKIDYSLLSTTSFELPEVEELIRLYGKDSKSLDYTTLHQAIHFVHHMYTAHVKIAFLMFMKVVHNIDMRSLDTINKQMCNHSFFVNFEATHMPDELVWQNKMPVATRKWLETQQMLHTCVSIKTYDDGDNTEKWAKAPVMNPTTQRAALQDWHADIDAAPLPRFPYEKSVAVPVECVTIKRVDIKKIVDLVHIAASKASNKYYDAIKLIDRTTKIKSDGKTITVSIKRRLFPDKCFLSRAQQFSRSEPWNELYRDGIEVYLNQRQSKIEDDPLDFYWGYEDPNVKRDTFKVQIDYENADETAWRKWDQLDVRMHFFDKAMQEDDSWKDAVNGMWYLQDYHAFFDMLRNLPKPNLPHAVLENGLITTVPKAFVAPATRVNQARLEHTVKSLAASKYAFKIKKSTNFHEAYPTDDDTFNMPVLSETSERAHHMFSILAWFFDCRDAGACRWQWEDKVLDYFGVNLPSESPDSDFDKFRFQKKKDANTTDTKYFDNTWFLMTVFLEVNFRNALAALHCRLWEKQERTRSVTGKTGVGLQVKAKELYNRQRSLLNTRARCVGLQGVSAGLSWQKNPQRNCLRNLLLSSLDDTLPDLDPQLEAYLRQFNAPNAGLFLRTIEVSNVLALRELALQHKLASQNQTGASKLEARLSWYEPAVQSEIRHLMHCVERDDSVFTAAPVVHPTKAIVLEEELMRKWMRQTLGVHQHLHTLRCPLDVKFHMFTAPETYRVLMQLFCTKTQLDNSHTQRPVLFVLLQVLLAAEVLKGTKVEFDGVLLNTAVNKVQRTNPALNIAIPNLNLEQCHQRYDLSIMGDTISVPCTPGSSLATWPLRDQNLWCKPERTSEKKVIYEKKSDTSINLNQKDLIFKLHNQDNEMKLKFPKEDDQITRDMAHEELKRWLLLACARPGHCQYERQDNGRYTPGEKKHEFTTQDCAVRQQAEWPHASETGRQRDTIIAAVGSFEVVQNRLHVALCDDTDTHLFFEEVEQLEQHKEAEQFPQYIQDIITVIPNRTRIYMPQVFATHLRKQEQGLHDKIYMHDKKYWRMVCVGYRAWAWKRLLVKSIFFDALTKVVTRSSMLLSLLQNPVDSDDFDNQEKQNQLYRDMLADTKDTFGALELKKDKIKDNLNLKKIQVVLTVFRKKRRRDIFRIPEAQRQVTCCQNLTQTQGNASRYLLIDKRMHEALLTHKKKHAVKELDVLHYRSYIFLVSTDTKNSQHSVLSLKDKLYVKFPLQKSDDFVEKYFATCWDCRRYSCLKPDYLLSPDSAETIQILTTQENSEALFKQITTNNSWLSTPHDDLNACKYICLDTDNRFYFKKKMIPFIEHSALLIKNVEQQHMYTLPDIFRKDNITNDNILSISQKDKWTDENFINDFLNSNDLEGKCKLFNKLRNSSRYIVTNPDEDDLTKMEVLDTGDANFDEPFKEIMNTLRRRILPKPNEDT